MPMQPLETIRQKFIVSQHSHAMRYCIWQVIQYSVKQSGNGYQHVSFIELKKKEAKTWGRGHVGLWMTCEKLNLEMRTNALETWRFLLKQ